MHRADPGQVSQLSSTSRRSRWWGSASPGDPTGPAGLRPSPAPSETASIAAHARRCGALLRELGVTRAHWVGHSSSCCIGLQLALDDPGLVASLVLFEPAKPSGRQRAAAASGYVGPVLAAAAAGDMARA